MPERHRIPYTHHGTIMQSTTTITIHELLAQGHISVRTRNVCQNHGLNTLADIQAYAMLRGSFMSLSGAGKRTHQELQRVLAMLPVAEQDMLTGFKCPEPLAAVLTSAVGELQIPGELSPDAVECLNAATNIDRLYTALRYRPGMMAAEHVIGALPPGLERVKVLRCMADMLKFMAKMLGYEEGKEARTMAANAADLANALHSHAAMDLVHNVLTPMQKRHLENTLFNIALHAPRRACTLLTDMPEPLAFVIPKLDMPVEEFVTHFGNRSKGASELHRTVIVPFAQAFRAMMASGDDDLTLQIKGSCPFLMPDEVSRAYAFARQEGHLPMFAITMTELSGSPVKAHRVLLRYLSMDSNPHTQSTIAREEGLTRERIRQLLMEPRLDMLLSSRNEAWNAYPFDAEPVLTGDSALYRAACREWPEMAFGAFAAIVREVARFESVTKPFDYLVQPANAEAAAALAAHIDDLAGRRYTRDTVVPLAELFPEGMAPQSEAWCRIAVAMAVGEGAVECDGGVLFRQNRIDVADEAVAMLRERNAPMHLSDIIDRLNGMYPHAVFNTVTVKYRLRLDDRITHMGKSSQYKLTEWSDCYSGHIRDRIREVLVKSKIPVSLDDIMVYVQEAFPRVQRKSVQVSLSGGVDFVAYSKGRWGLAGKTYPEAYCLQPGGASLAKTFEEHMAELKAFVDTHGRLPYNNTTQPAEASVKRWMENIQSGAVGSTEAERAELTQYLQTLDGTIATTGRETLFAERCRKLLQLVADNGRLPVSDDGNVYFWFRKHVVDYGTLDPFCSRVFGETLDRLYELGHDPAVRRRK